MAIHPTRVVVRRAGEIVDQVTRPPRTLPTGSLGIEYMGLVYPFARPGEIETDGEWYYPGQAPICLDAPETQLEPNPRQIWLLDTTSQRPYLFIRGSEHRLYDALRLLGQGGFIVERWGPSFVDDHGGTRFNWFIRLPHIDTLAPPSSWELQQIFNTLAPEEADISAIGEADPPGELREGAINQANAAIQIAAVERELAGEIKRADASEAKVAALRQAFDQEIKRASEAAAFLRAALAHTQIQAPRADLAPSEDASKLGSLLDATKADLANALDHWLRTEEALQTANDELAKARARTAELEVLLAAQSPRPSSTITSGRSRMALKDLETTLSVFAPSILLLRDSAHFISIEVADRSDLYAKLRTLDEAPQSLRSKRVHAADGWLELHFSTGLARDGRLYFKKLQVDGRPRWGVVVSDKAAQPRDFAWIAAQ